MNDELKEKLKGYGLNDDQITGVNELGVMTIDDMELVTELDLTELKVKVIVARKIVRDFTATPEPNAPAQVQAPLPVPPQTINVTLDKQYADKNESELLNDLVVNPADEEAYDELVMRDKFLTAKSKGKKGANIVLGADEAIDPTRTLGYWRFLNKPRSRPRRSYQGGTVITLEKALGRLDRSIHHPMVDGEVIIENMDSVDQDWRGVDVTRMEAFYWARTTGHQYWVETPNLFEAYKIATAETLDSQYQAMVEDWLNEKEAGEVISLTADDQGAGSGQSMFRESYPSQF